MGGSFERWWWWQLGRDHRALSDDELLRRLTALMDQHRQVESEVVAHIAEVDERKLYRGEGCSSMHSYCTEVLHLSEAGAYLRIIVARASRRFPVLLVMLADGRMHLSGIAKLAPQLTAENLDRCCRVLCTSRSERLRSW